MTYLSRSSMLLMLALLGACAAAPLTPAGADWQTNRDALTALDNWQLRGKLAVVTQDSADSVNVNWNQQGAITHLILSGPIGWGRASINSDGQTLQLERNGETSTVMLDDERALVRLLGWPMPVALLPWWIRGLPAPDLPVDVLELQQGQLRVLSQQGWQLTYERYQPVGELQLPSKIRFRSEGAEGKILIKQWLPDPTP
ncbi:outer membrane lipoprotein LolB [Halieaceae bacterium IMCC14734]|uniref:Outer-membrane lipoprotein LolB n=1 Tax=Candidatus Litorirhabdus singularis TaxID=2518993 RepID=A0ABT3TM55_9GAMM|nr:lipoprotein insertase outer membrane protein LolB [Candidatus Litorirhabdus singularis]MCX2982484.1 outer membrane lipoprotein LolB [Candidatus Litorirhabdus singularis]